MKKSIRSTSILLLLSIMLPTLAACGENNVNSTDSPDGQFASPEVSAENIPETEPETELTDGLPDTDMDGFSLNVLHFDQSWLSWANNILEAEEMTGEILNDTVYERNRKIEERFNCVMNIEGINQITASYIGELVMSGDSSRDVATMYDLWVVGGITNLMAWEDMPYINFEADWWNPTASEVFNIGGKQYAMSGSFSISVLSRAAGFAFNKGMLNDLNVGWNPYDLAKEGTWTIDKMYEAASLAVMDLNGDGALTDDDCFGINGSVKELYNRLILGSGINYITKDEAGLPVFSLPTDEVAIDKLQHIMDLNRRDKAYYNTSTNVDAAAPGNLFENGRALFVVSPVHSIASMRDYEVDIGVLPCPKYDEAQTRYYAPSFGAEIFILMKSFDMSRAENVGMLLEALSFDSEMNLIPMYKETLLKTKVARDMESSDMLDIIFDNISFDFGINAWQEEVSNKMMREIFLNLGDNLISSLTKMTKGVNATIKQLSKKISQ